MPSYFLLKIVTVYKVKNNLHFTALYGVCYTQTNKEGDMK